MKRENQEVRLGGGTPNDGWNLPDEVKNAAGKKEGGQRKSARGGEM